MLPVFPRGTFMADEPYYRFVKGSGWCLGYWDEVDLIDYAISDAVWLALGVTTPEEVRGLRFGWTTTATIRTVTVAGTVEV